MVHRASVAMRAVVNFLYCISEIGYFVAEIPDFVPQGVGDVRFELFDIHLGEVHVFLSIVGFEALDFLPVATAVEEPAATSGKGDEGEENVPEAVHTPFSFLHCRTSKQGQALLAYSLWPWMEVMGNSSIRSLTSWRRAARWLGVRVSAGCPEESSPPT